MRKPVIGVMGGSKANAAVEAMARQLGRLIAERGWILPNGGRDCGVMAASAAGGDRQALHERIRVHSQAASRRVKMEGKDNDLLERLADDSACAGVNLKAVTDPKQYVGRAPQQVDEFIREFVTPIRRRYRKVLSSDSELFV